MADETATAGATGAAAGEPTQPFKVFQTQAEFDAHAAKIRHEAERKARNSGADVAELEEMLASLQRDIPRHKVLLMPEGVTPEALRARSAWLSELCKARGYRYAHRLHVELYGNRRGT